MVSVCIPAYNSGQYIAATINSLLIQSYKNLEIIVVDDGSSDDTVNVLKAINDDKLRYITQTNRGASAARNAAYKHSSGDFIKFMDADDLLSPDCIDCQLQKIINHPNSIASAKWGRFQQADKSDFKLSPEKVWKDLTGIDWLVDSLMDTGANMMQPGIFLIPRAVIEKAGPWDESLSLIDDFDYMVRVITNSAWVFFCENAVLMYRSGLSHSLSGKNSPLHMASAFNSLSQGIEQILNTRNDAATRQACANTYQRWSYQFYPFHQPLYSQLEKKINNLGGSNNPIIGSRPFLALAKLVGWKRAKKIRLLITGNE